MLVPRETDEKLGHRVDLPEGKSLRLTANVTNGARHAMSLALKSF